MKENFISEKRIEKRLTALNCGKFDSMERE